MKWTEIRICTTHEAVEAISNILYEAGVGGVAIQDPEDIKIQQKEQGSWDYIDENIWEKVDQGVYVIGYFPETIDLLEKINVVKKRIKDISKYGIDLGIGEVTTTEIYEEDWTTSWKQYYKPIKLGENIVIKPTWEKYTSKEGEKIIELDPGMAFGTGTHETTKLCIEFLEKFMKTGSCVLDIGTGSGILGITAAKLGASKVIGVDIDPLAVKVARENVCFNQVENIMEIRQGNLLDVVKEQGDIVVANIIADIIIQLFKNIKKFLKGDGIFIASGIILGRLEDVKEACRKENIKIVSIKVMGEWAALCLTLA